MLNLAQSIKAKGPEPRFGAMDVNTAQVESASERTVPHSSGRSLARNTIWNLTGYATPMLVAVFVIPVLIRDLGTAKYGVITLAWGVVGYFGIFDMGLSDALTKLVAERVGDNSQDEIANLFNTGFLMLAGSSIAGAILLAAIARPLAYSWLNVLPELRHETFVVFLIFAAALPFVVSAACFRGTLSAFQRFDLVNKVQIASGIITFAGPAAVLPFTHNLIPIVIVLAMSRVFAWIAYLFVCVEIMPSTWAKFKWSKETVRPLITFGGWISVSNITDPLFLYSDRFLLGAMISMSAVAYYSTPFDVVVRLWMIPDALNTAFFPAYAASLKGDGFQATQLLERAGNYLFPAILAPVLLIVLFSTQILTFWIGPGFALKSARVFSWLAVGVLLSSVGRIPWTLLIADRPDLPAKLVLIEAPMYLAVLYLSVRFLGLDGAAIAWACRCTFNCLALHTITWRMFPQSHKAIKKNSILLVMAVVVLAGAVMVPPAVTAKLLFFAGSYGGVLVLGWSWLLSPEERRAMTPASYFA